MQKTIFEYVYTIRSRVYMIYREHQMAVESDAVLITLYKKNYGPAAYKEDQIKRAGRYWRNTKKLFTRVYSSEELEREFKEVYANGVKDKRSLFSNSAMRGDY